MESLGNAGEKITARESMKSRKNKTIVSYYLKKKIRILNVLRIIPLVKIK